MGVIIPPTSPWEFYRATDANGHLLTATVTFSGAWADTTALTGATVFRDPTCLYVKVIIGSINSDGTFPAGTKVVNVPAGTTPITAGQLGAVGLNTIADILHAPQITASP